MVYQPNNRLQRPPSYNPRYLDQMGQAFNQGLSVIQKNELHQRNSEAAIAMMNIETDLTKQYIDAEQQVDSNGEIDGIPLPEYVSNIRKEAYKDFNPPSEYEDQYNIQQTKHQSLEVEKTYRAYGEIKAKKAVADLKNIVNDITITTSWEQANQNLNDLGFLIDNANISETEKSKLRTSMAQAHNNQMWRNEINNLDNSVELLKIKHKAFKSNDYSVGLENFKTIDKLFIAEIRKRNSANDAYNKVQKKHQRNQINRQLKRCKNIDSTSNECDFKLHLTDNNLGFTESQLDAMRHYEEVRKPVIPVIIHMAAGNSAGIDKVREKLVNTVNNEKLSENIRSVAKEKYDEIDNIRSEFEIEIRKDDGLDFVVAQINKSDNTDIMEDADPLSAKRMTIANSLYEGLGVWEQDRKLLPRELREQLAVDPHKTVKEVLTIADEQGWDDTTRRVVTNQMREITGLPDGMSILLDQDNGKGAKALEDYKNNRELYAKLEPDENSENTINSFLSEDETYKKLVKSNMPAKLINRITNAVKIQALSYWQLDGDDLKEKIENTYKEISDKYFVFSEDKINDAPLRFDKDKVSQEQADEYTNAIQYMIKERELLENVINWDSIQGDYDKEEVLDRAEDAQVMSFNNDTEFELISGTSFIPLIQTMTWKGAKKLVDDYKVTKGSEILHDIKLPSL